PVYWPYDLVPQTLPHARVMTFGYETHLKHPLVGGSNKSTVNDIASDLLISLESERRTDYSRPLVFIAHSLGGIVVKEMLVKARWRERAHPRLYDIFCSTVSIIFFGTPHGGADPSRFIRHVAEKALRTLGFSVNEQVLDTLLPSCERLRELNNEFSIMAQEQKWSFYSFQEEKGVRALGDAKIVEDISSRLNLPFFEIVQHIGRNHMDMCRFTGTDDIEYRKVAAALENLVGSKGKEVASSQRPENTTTQVLDDSERQQLKNSLEFQQMDARQMSVKRAHLRTCRWLLKKPEYIDWLDMSRMNDHQGFLWIRGKPGAGKSTLAKFAVTNKDARKLLQGKTIISFFFNARGDELEKSTVGMYRSLLLQLFKAHPQLLSAFDSLHLPRQLPKRDWDIETLQELLELTVQRLGSVNVACFIDALDECDEDQIRDMIDSFQRLGNISPRPAFHVFFASRHYPHISLEKGLEFILERQEEHSADITSYVNSKLMIGGGNTAQKIRAELQEKADGVFMWVVLVVDLLVKEHDRGSPPSRLLKKLKSIPGDLHKLFRDMLRRDSHNKNDLLLCIQWVLFASRPLKPEELYYAILSGTEPDDLGIWDREAVPDDDIRKFILNASKGLADITKSKIPTAQFIHESVRDFLLKENGLQELWPELQGQLEGKSNDRLKDCCLAYLQLKGNRYGDMTYRLPQATSSEAAKRRQDADMDYPFLWYATDNILVHANTAASLGVDQHDFIDQFPRPLWIHFNNTFKKFQVRHHSTEATLLYILAEFNAPSLIAACPDHHKYWDIEKERYGTPILAALATGS
ncbi:hypothetical protein GQ53DRAFT_599418, partial [Thozetella sp. PMI_491]